MFNNQELEIFEKLLNKEKTALVDCIVEYQYEADIESLRKVLNLREKTQGIIQEVNTFPETR